MRRLVAVFCATLFLAATARAADVDELIKQLKDKDSDVRRAAAKSLSEMGMEAKPALPALTKALKDDDKFVRRFSAQSIGELGADAKDAVPALKDALLKDSAKEVVDAAAGALAKIGPDGVTPLTDLVKDKKKDLKTRKTAVSALGSMGKDVSKPAIAALSDALKDNELRIDAVTALGDLGPDAKSAVDAISDALKDNKDRNFRQAANAALARIRGRK
jgi:HEAT repeat protein